MFSSEKTRITGIEDHTLKWRRLIQYWNTNPVMTQDEKLIPVAGGINDVPFMNTGRLTYLNHLTSSH